MSAIAVTRWATNLYTGRGGQMAVMAEFLMRRYNVAIPWNTAVYQLWFAKATASEGHGREPTQKE